MACKFHCGVIPVSYTHLDVYKRQVSLVDGIEVSASNVQAAFVIACFTIVTILEREFRSEKDEE